MSRRTKFATLAAFAVAASAATAGAWYAADFVERTSRDAVEDRLAEARMDWVEVSTDGLQLILSGYAPDEPSRFRAITEAGVMVDPGRVIDAMDVVPSRPVTAPAFSLEILRNEAGVSLIGLIPSEGGPEMLSGLLGDIPGATALDVTDMVETADYDKPDGWEDALRFAVRILADLPRSKLSVSPGHVMVAAVADSAEQKVSLERRLRATKPDDVSLDLQIKAPRPVIAPFTLRFVMPPGGAPRFEACAVDSEGARTRVLAAATDAGFRGNARCVIALGVPSATWGIAASRGIVALGALGGGTLTLSDADVALVAPEGTDRRTFDRVVAELETELPDLFVLSAMLPETPENEDGSQTAGIPEFTATRSPEGQVQLRGRLFDEAQEAAVLSYGRALFGVGNTYIATREDRTLPQGWPIRVLVALDALSRLENGAAIVDPERIEIRGVTGNANVAAELSGLFSEKLGADATYNIDVEYREELDPLLNIPTPEECETRLNSILVEQKLTFAPGEAVIEAAGDGQVGRLAAQLGECERAAFEIGGHTDSQGREEMNADLSKQRAEAVRAALIARGVAPDQLVSRGYGETQPIADNDTEEGREANRRITFTLLGRRQADSGARVTAPVPSDADPADATPVDEASDEDGTADASESPTEETTGEGTGE